MSTRIDSNEEELLREQWLLSESKALTKPKKKQSIIQMIRQDCSCGAFMTILLIVLFCITLGYIGFTIAPTTFKYFEPFSIWFEKNPITGFFSFSALYLVWIPLALPSSFMSLLGGFVFSRMYGPMKGYFICMLSICLGHPIACLITFYIGRTFFQSYIQRNLVKKVRIFRAIDASFKTQGLKLACLLRVPPVIPWNVLNYALSVTSCQADHFLIGTLIGIFPGTTLWLYIGINIEKIDGVIQGERKMSIVEIVFMILSAIALFVLIHLIIMEAKKELDKILEAHDDQNYQSSDSYLVNPVESSEALAHIDDPEKFTSYGPQSNHTPLQILQTLYSDDYSKFVSQAEVYNENLPYPQEV